MTEGGVCRRNRPGLLGPYRYASSEFPIRSAGTVRRSGYHDQHGLRLSPARAAFRAPPKPSLTPAERALLLAAGPTYIETAQFGPPDSTLSAEVEPDDWRLYYLMRELG